MGMAPGGICPPKFIPIMPCMLGCMTGTIGKPCCCCCCCCCCMGTMPAGTHTQTLLWCTADMAKNSVLNYYLKHDSTPNLKYIEAKLIQVWSKKKTTQTPPESGHDSVLQINFPDSWKKTRAQQQPNLFFWWLLWQLGAKQEEWREGRKKRKSLCLFSQMLCELTARAEQPAPTDDSPCYGSTGLNKWLV